VFPGCPFRVIQARRIRTGASVERAAASEPEKLTKSDQFERSSHWIRTGFERSSGIGRDWENSYPPEACPGGGAERGDWCRLGIPRSRFADVESAWSERFFFVNLQENENNYATRNVRFQ
jgi:hypothetical protein